MIESIPLLRQDALLREGGNESHNHAHGWMKERDLREGYYSIESLSEVLIGTSILSSSFLKS